MSVASLSQFEEQNLANRSLDITECLDRAKLGESYAQQQLWDCYLHRLLNLARDRLRGIVDATVAPDDVATSVFCAFLTGVRKGRFRRLNNRDDLWQVLVMLTKRTAINERRRVGAIKRRSNQTFTRLSELGDRRGELEEMTVITSNDPTPAEACQLSEKFESRLKQLPDDRLRQVALARLSGFTNVEIAEQLNCSLRSVERKLAIIRRRWQSES